MSKIKKCPTASGNTIYRIECKGRVSKRYWMTRTTAEVALILGETITK